MIDLPKLLRQLSLARVVLKRLPVSTEATKLRITDDLAPVDVGIVDQDINANASQDKDVRPSKYIDNDVESHADSVAIEDACQIVNDADKNLVVKPTTSCRRQKHPGLIKRCCPKCEKLVEDVSVYKKQLCTECDTPITYQCARCDKQFCNYHSMIYHLNSKCYPQNLDLKCTECDYRTHAKYLLRQHKKRCSSRFIYSCSQCEFKSKYQGSIRRHMQELHKVISGDNCSIAVETEKSLADESTTTGIRQKYAGLIKRYCPKCEKLVEDAYIHKKLLCTECDTLMTYQCARCDKQYKGYGSLCFRLRATCNTQKLDLKCPQCDYRTHAKAIMTKHLSLCLSGIIFNCGLCEQTTKFKSSLLNHIINVHKDIFNVDCSQCKTKWSKCKRCQNMVHFCETCHTGFGSTNKFQEHQKSCKQPVLECKYCPFETNLDNKLKMYMKFEHLSGLIS